MSSGRDQFRKAFSKVRAAINDLELDTLPEIAEVVRARIQTQARSGKTMKSGTLEKIKALSPDYIETRKGWKRAHGAAVGKIRKDYLQDDFNYGGIGFEAARRMVKAAGVPDTGEFFSPTRSNLTVTGQYLDSIKTKSIEKKTATIVIGATGARKGEKLTNAKLAEYLGMQGRSIWGIDNITLKRIITMVKADIRNAIRRNLLKK